MDDNNLMHLCQVCQVRPQATDVNNHGDGEMDAISRVCTECAALFQDNRRTPVPSAPEGWPNYVPYPPTAGMPLPPGWQYDPGTGVIRRAS